MRVVPSVDNLSATWRLLIVGAGMVLMLSVGALPWPVTSNTGVLIILATIALVAGLFDATIAGALQSRIAGGWGLVPEALLGVLLGFAVLLYPHVPLDAIAMLLSVWMLARGIMLLTVGRGAASDPLTLTLALGWATVSVFAPAAMPVSLGRSDDFLDRHAHRLRGDLERCGALDRSEPPFACAPTADRVISHPRS